MQSTGQRLQAVFRVTAIVAMSAVAVVGCGRADAPPEPVRSVRTMRVLPGAAEAQLSYAGEIRARTESRLGFRVGGKLAERPVQLGDTVRKGQVLARLDPQDLKLAEQAARAGVEAASVNAVQAEADLKRFKGLHDQGFISAAELERRTTAARAAQAQLEQVRAQADVQGRQTGYGALLADASGVITGVEAEPGAVLAAGTPVVRLAWDGPRDVVFAVPEDRVAALRGLGGRTGALSVEGWGDGAFKARATVREVSAAADPTTRTFQVKAGLEPAPGGVLPRLGQTATVALPGDGRAVVLKVPLTALTQQQGRSAVWVLEPAGDALQVRLQPVVVATADGSAAVIASGLSSGQEIVTAGTHVLTAGQKVRRYVAPNASGAPSAASPPAPPASQAASTAPATPAIPGGVPSAAAAAASR